jgi:hypothetical protein
MTKIKSKYSASMTGCGFVFNEFNSVLPLLMSSNSKELIKQEVINNQYLMMNSENTRKRCVSELQKRFAAVPESFWQYYMNLNDDDKRIALLYSLLKAYAILKDLHQNVVQPQWNSIDKTLNGDNLLVEIYNIASSDEFVDSWSEQTKQKIVSWYQTVLFQVGMLSRADQRLRQVRLVDDTWFHEEGETWFLEACLI